MAEFQNFRSAFNGFNREDVVHYIEYLNNRHASEKNQMQTELQTLQAQLDARSGGNAPEDALTARLEEANARCAELEAEIAELRAKLKNAAQAQTSEELEAYRRAERTERVANERVSQLYAQANGAVADAAVQVDDVSKQLGAMADQVTAQLGQLQAAVLAGKTVLRSAAATLYAIKPIDDPE